MTVQKGLLEEFERLSKINDLLENKINQGKKTNNEPEQITRNILAMCEIAKTLHY